VSLDWEKLRLFHLVAEAGSFTEGARRLGMSQPALSRQIGALEDTLGAKLFHRHARGLAMTHEGEQLAEASHEIFERVERTRQAIELSRDHPSGEIRLTTTVSFGSTWLAEVITDFLKRYPDIRVTMVLSDDDLDLQKREADVAVRFHPPTQGDLIQRPLSPISYRICAAPDYIAAHGVPESVDDLDRHRIIAYGDSAPGTIRGVNWLLDVGRKGPPRAPVLAVNSIFGIMKAVESGAGIAALPSYLIRTSHRVKVILPSVQGPVFRTHFVYVPELKSAIRVKVLRDFLIERMTPAALDVTEHHALDA
jgi:DNA-binding transcriptional LysR family regulator